MPSRSEIGDEDLGNFIAKALRSSEPIHKVLVIDEVDCFEAHEKSFLCLMKAILKQHTNTSIIGIANSVDLPFKKKYSAIAMRDAQLLFTPYSNQQLIDILEQKLNLQFAKFPDRLREIKDVFFNLSRRKSHGSHCEEGFQT